MTLMGTKTPTVAFNPALSPVVPGLGIGLVDCPALSPVVPGLGIGVVDSNDGNPANAGDK